MRAPPSARNPPTSTQVIGLREGDLSVLINALECKSGWGRTEKVLSQVSLHSFSCPLLCPHAENKPVPSSSKVNEVPTWNLSSLHHKESLHLMCMATEKRDSSLATAETAYMLPENIYGNRYRPLP